MTIYSHISANRTKTYLLMVFFVILMTSTFWLIGAIYGDPQLYLFIGLLISSVSAISSYFWSDTLVLKMANARPAKKEDFFDFYTVTENLSIASGLPMPKLFVIDDPVPNAFATGRNPSHAVVAATTGLLTSLDRSEIEGVVAHELSHIKNYDMLVMTVVAVLVGTLVFVTDWIMRTLWWGGMRRGSQRRTGGFEALILIFVLVITPLLAVFIKLMISRKREYLADASGALLTRNPEGLAGALEKISSFPQQMQTATHAIAHLYISNPFRGEKGAPGWISRLFSTHPPVEDRVRILRSM